MRPSTDFLTFRSRGSVTSIRPRFHTASRIMFRLNRGTLGDLPITENPVTVCRPEGPMISSFFREMLNFARCRKLTTALTPLYVKTIV